MADPSAFPETASAIRTVRRKLAIVGIKWVCRKPCCGGAVGGVLVKERSGDGRDLEPRWISDGKSLRESLIFRAALPRFDLAAVIWESGGRIRNG